MATREGARALGLEDELGSIEPGKRADLIVVERDRPHLAPDRDPWSTLAYAARGTDVRLTMVDGEVLVQDFALVHLDPHAIASEARYAAAELAVRAGHLTRRAVEAHVRALTAVSVVGRGSLRLTAVRAAGLPSLPSGKRARPTAAATPGSGSGASRLGPCIMKLSTHRVRVLRTHVTPS